MARNAVHNRRTLRLCFCLGLLALLSFTSFSASAASLLWSTSYLCRSNDWAATKSQVDSKLAQYQAQDPGRDVWVTGEVYATNGDCGVYGEDWSYNTTKGIQILGAPKPDCGTGPSYVDDSGRTQCGVDPTSCSTDTIAGGPVNGGWGTGVYDVQGCAYSCGTNYSKLDGSTSLYDAQECIGTGQPYSSDDPDDYPDAPAECTVRSADGSCLDMAQQPGGSCPAGTTYGEVNGSQVCVPSGDSTDPLDPGTQGKNGQGGSEPTDLGTGNGESDGTNGGGTSENGSSTTTGTETGTTECTSTTNESGTTTQSCTTTGGSTEETDYGTVTTPAIGENQFYKPIDKTAESVVGNFKNKVMDTPIVSSVDGFFEVQLSGSCPTWTIPGVWVFDPMPIDAQCSAAMANIWPFIAAILIATCGFFAFRIAFL